MCTQHRQWIAITIPLLNLCTADGIWVVACPDLRHEAEHPKIEPVPTACAGFKEDMWEFLCRISNTSYNPSMYLCANDMAITLRINPGFSFDIREITIHVPFDIRNLARWKYMAHGIYDISSHFFSCKIKRHLVSSDRMWHSLIEIASYRIENCPVRVLSETILCLCSPSRVLPRFQSPSPAELIFWERPLSPCGNFSLLTVQSPSEGIIIPLSKPSIIKDEQFCS